MGVIYRVGAKLLFGAESEGLGQAPSETSDLGIT